MAGELILSFVPDPQKRLWRMMTRTRHQLTRDRVRIHSQSEAFLEDARIKLSSCLSDLLGMSGRDMLKALAAGGKDAAAMRRVLNQVANAAVKPKAALSKDCTGAGRRGWDTIRRFGPSLILCRLAWKILHQGFSH